MNVKTNVMRLLDAAGIAYQAHSYDGANGTLTGAEIARMLGQEPMQVFKTLVTTGASGKHYVFVLPVTEELSLKKAAAAAGEKKIEMLKARDLLPLTGYVHGGCSPIGMKKLFPTFVDESAELWDSICFSGGKIGCQVQVAPSDLETMIPLAYADVTEA